MSEVPNVTGIRIFVRAELTYVDRLLLARERFSETGVGAVLGFEPRRRDQMQRPNTVSDESLPSGRELDEEGTPSATRIALGRGVPTRAEERGGHLFIWSTPHGAFERIKVGSSRPRDVAFPYSEDVEGIEVHLTDGTRAVEHLVVKCWWWLPHQPFVADTGLDLGGGG